MKLLIAFNSNISNPIRQMWWEYFVFPKIQFSGKGNLVKQIIDECNFLPKNVLFIDDNHSNRKEVQYYNKDIMVEDEYFIFKMLNDGRFQNLKKHNPLWNMKFTYHM